jgi:hypothetical protein
MKIVLPIVFYIFKKLSRSIEGIWKDQNQISRCENYDICGKNTLSKIYTYQIYRIKDY